MNILRNIVIVGLLVSSAAARAEVVVVVAANSPITGLKDAQIVDIFLGKLTRLPNGVTALPFDQAEGSPVRDEFYSKLAGKSPAQLKAFWSKLIFTGRGRPPKVMADSLQVIKSLRDNPVAIGYVERDKVDQTVRILR